MGSTITDDSGNSISIQSTPGDDHASRAPPSISIESASIDIKADASMTLKATGTLTIQGALVMIN